MTLPTLKLISQEREWKGVASTTQLLNGTMLEFLKLTKPYCVDPDSRAFMLSGTKHHEGLEGIAKELGLPSEIPLNVDRDIFDLLELSEDGLLMTDYKLWGSFKVSKALGMTAMGKKPDPSGAVYKTTTKWGKQGEPKQVTVWERIPANVDMWEQEYQLNHYRVMLARLGIHIAKMQLQVTVRDGGLAVASSRGITRNVYRIPVKRLEDSDVDGYFQFKDDNLHRALDLGVWTTPCTFAETWEDRRCQGYCEVAQYCPKGMLLAKIEEMEKEAI